MDYLRSVFVLLSCFYITHIACEISYEKKNKLVNGFIDFYNTLPNQIYTCSEGYLQNAQQSTEQNSYEIEVTLKVSNLHNLESTKNIRCTGKVVDLEEVGVSVLNHHCEDVNSGDKDKENEEIVVTEASTDADETEFVRKPIQLDNEVQTNTAVTSGEQFIAIPREDEKVHCIGCSSHVNPQAAGVSELAAIGVRQLNYLEPNVQHTLNSVLDVERQVQVINGIRYILTLVIDYNSCLALETLETETCLDSKTCKITFLEKPWVKLPDGSKYRAILSNNCTEEWLFGDNGVVIPQTPTDSRENHNINAPQTDGSDVIKSVHNVEVQAQPLTDKALTDDEIKVIQTQIIPCSQFKEHRVEPAVTASSEPTETSELSKEHVVKVEQASQFSPNAIPETNTNPIKIENLSEDKKKAIDDMLNFFNFAGFDSARPDEDRTRTKRSYDSDLNIMNLVEKFQKVKKNVENAKYVYKLAQIVVDYLNEIDIQVKTRVLKDVLNAEEELENHQHFYYIQSRVIIPCDKSECDEKDTISKICNAVLDATNKNVQILNVFCHDEPKSKPLGKVNSVALNDPVLLKLITEATNKIESESSLGKALKINKVIDANTQRVSGTLTKFSIMLDITNCETTVPSVFRSNCSIMEELGSQICDVTVHERRWLKERKITYTCAERPVDTSFSSKRKTEVKKNINDPVVLDMVNEALQYLYVQSNRNNKMIVVRVNSVATQLVAGFLTDIEFVVGYTTCTNDVKDDTNNCKLLEDEPLRICKAKVWDRTWIEDRRQVDVSCKDSIIEDSELSRRVRREVNVLGAESNKDVNDPEFKIMAEDALQKYLQSSVYNRHFKVVSVHQVTVQVVAGTLTKLEFKISPTTCLIDKEGNPSSHDCKVFDHNDVSTCISKIWEKPWLKFKEINTTCQVDKDTKRVKRSKIKVAEERYTARRLLSYGGETNEEVDNPIFKIMAKNSLQKFLQTAGSNQHYELISIEKVTILPGHITKLEFSISPTNCQLDTKRTPSSSECKIIDAGDRIRCSSEILEQEWHNSKDIDVTCHVDDVYNRVKRKMPGGEQNQDLNDPKFRKLAEESMHKYLQSNGNTILHHVLTLNKVTTQVVSGHLTKIDFKISPAEQTTGDVLSCHSEIWEQPWLQKKEITVNCVIDNLSRVKRQSVGGQIEQDPNDPKFRKLAEESMHKYLQSNGNTILHQVLSLNKVTTQVVSGHLTEIDFKISPAEQTTGNVLSCHSEIWEQPWLQKKEITVNCVIDNLSRVKRQSVGGQIEQDPNDPKFRKLAEESMHKYLQSNGNTILHQVLSLNKVTTQVVSGHLTEIDFKISPAEQTTGNVLSCHSEIWEQPWLQKKEITVNCVIDNLSRVKRQSVGGQIEQDPNDPKFRKLAEESMHKYLQSNGNTILHHVLSLNKVTTQVVSGHLTKIDFKISPAEQTTGDVLSCHSEIWEQPWLQKKEITVNCVIDNLSRVKRQSVGGQIEQDPNDPKFRKLAEESMHKYLQSNGNTILHQVLSLNKVTTQVVSGHLTEIDFKISPAEQTTGNVLSCHSEIWEQPWLQKKEITVNCVIDNLSRVKRQSVGGQIEQDPNDPKFRKLAEESMHKYLQSNGNTILHQVLSLNKVTTQVVSGHLTEIDFKISPAEQTTGNVLSCHSEIWEQPWLQKKEITVNCVIDNLSRVKRQSVGGQIEQDPNDPKFRKLAEESMHKYLQSNGNTILHQVLSLNKVTTQVVSGHLTEIDFKISPAEQTTGDVLSCHSEIWEQPWLQKKEITVNCVIDNLSRVKRQSVGGQIEQDPNDPKFRKLAEEEQREKRQTGADDEYADDDISFYYADRAIKQLNDQSNSNNLHKLVTIHGSQNSVHMDQPMVRMYIETAETYCLRHRDENILPDCDELNGMSHQLCLVRLWPSPDDELVVKQVSLVCDDDETFESISGLSIPALLKASLKEIEKSPYSKYKLVHQGEPQVIPTLDSSLPITINFIVASTNCSKKIDIDLDTANNYNCFMDVTKSSKACQSRIWLAPSSKTIKKIIAKCGKRESRKKRSISLNTSNSTADELIIQNLVQESLHKLEMSSSNRYKQRVLQINSYSTKITSGKVTTIDFDVAYTSCLKFEWVEDVKSCEFLEHLPRRHCVSQIWERLWIQNGRNIEVTCEEDETPLEAHVEFESAETAMKLATEALKHIEAKYPHPRRQKVVRIFSLEKQVVAGIHYRMKIEVGSTQCSALSAETGCKLDKDVGNNKFCRVNVWLRPWTNHAPNFRVSCDYQEASTTDLYHHLQAELLFHEFMTTYKPEYINNPSEMKRKFEIFKANVRKIHELNIHERGTATYGVTRFADLSYEEFTKKFLGLKPSLRDTNQVPMRQAEIPSLQIPDKFDWRTYDAVTEVKNQGSCGSCWAFSVTGNIEGQWKMQSGQLVSLSEQELVDCDKLDQGCNGGLPDNAYRAIEQLGGLELENDYPYEGEDDRCSFNKTMSRVKITGAVNITTNETGMAKWLVQNGPISIGINANAMQFYMGGVSHPWKMLCNPTNLDHGVLIVGYGIKDYPLFHKRLPFWTIKNSWGPEWGEQGYYRVYRGDGTCGVNQMASSAVI